jgi:hypothetical protein
LSGAFSFAANRVTENRIVEEYDRAPTIWQGNNDARPLSHHRERRLRAAVRQRPCAPSGRSVVSGRGRMAAGGNYDFQPGSLLGDWPNLFFYGNLDDIAIDNPTLDHWFNTGRGV